MTKQLELSIDSTALGSSGCILNFSRTIIGEVTEPEVGAYKSLPNAAMIYGVAVHKFIDVCYKTDGHFPSARKEATAIFNLPKTIDKKKGWIQDERHMLTTCYNLWTMNVLEEPSFEVLAITQKCWWCKGILKSLDNSEVCSHCKGTGLMEGPATELTFHIPIFEDEVIKVYLDGTIDRVGKFKGGCFAILDWKTTSSWNPVEYLSTYELSRQLRIYTLACKLTTRNNPESTLGKIGATKMGAAIDGVFLKANANDNEYCRGSVFQFPDHEMEAFRKTIIQYCEKVAFHVEHNYFPKEGILNGSCDGKWGKCRFWNVCKTHDPISSILLKRDFTRLKFDPLNYNDTGAI